MLKEKIKNNWFMTFLLICSMIMLFLNLGNSYAPIDEANTMILAKNTMNYGVPTVWDGEYLVSPFFQGDITSDKIWVSHPWLQFYVTALSFKLFGATTLAARIPYALAGFFCIVAIYFFAKLLSKSEMFAKLASALLAFNVAFLVYSRQSRYYSLTILFTIVTMYMFLMWLNARSRKYLSLFILSSTLLFHSYYPFWVFLTMCIGIYGLIIIVRSKQWDLLKDFVISHIVLALLTLSWFVYAKPHAPMDMKPELEKWIKNFAIYFWKLNSWISPVYTLAFIFLILWLLKKFRIIKGNSNTVHFNRMYLLFVCVPLYIAFISIIPILTTQYAMPALPIFIILATFFILKIYEYNRYIGIVVLIFCLTTNIWNIFPYLIIEKTGVSTETVEKFIPNSRCDFVEGASLKHYISDEMVIRSYLSDYIKSLFSDYDNRIEGIVNYLNENGQEDQTVLSFWADANAIRFYTGMNVIYEFFPLYEDEEIEALIHKPTEKIDWIIFDTLDFYPVENPYFDFDFDDYELAEVAYPKEYHDNVPNIDFFEFLTNNDAPQSFYILKLKSDE